MHPVLIVHPELNSNDQYNQSFDTARWGLVILNISHQKGYVIVMLYYPYFS